MKVGKLGAVLSLFFVLVGCATNKINWNSRVGAYTFDNAVIELGVPDRSATLSDGTTVAEWLQYRGSEVGTVHFFPGSRLQTYDVTRFPDSYLRLVFGPDKRLLRAEKFAR